MKAIALTCLGVQRMFFNAWNMNMDDPKAGCPYCRGIGKALMARLYQSLKHRRAKKDDDQNAKIIRELGDLLYFDCSHFLEEGIVLLGECQNLYAILDGHEEMFLDQLYLDRVLYEESLLVHSEEEDKEPAFKGYADFDKRLSSFQGSADNQGWGEGLPAPHILSDAGLFWTRTGDTVRCFHCGICLFKWIPDDNPIEKHACKYPKCGFLQGYADRHGQHQSYQNGKQQFDKMRSKYLEMEPIDGDETADGSL